MSTFPGYLDAMLQTRYIKEVYPAVKHIIIDFYEVSFDMSSHNSFLKPVYEPHQRRRIGLKFHSHIRRWCQRSETPESETSLWINEDEILEEWTKRCTQQNPGKTSNSFYIRNQKGGGLHCTRHAILNTVRPISAGISVTHGICNLHYLQVGAYES